MKKISKIIVFIVSIAVIAFLLPLPAIADYDYSFWKQTSASDFASGTLVNIDTTTESGTFRVTKTTEAINQQYTTGQDNFAFMYDTDNGQSFKPSIDCICTKIEIYLKKVSSPTYDITVHLKADNNNSPGPTLASGTISYKNVKTSYTWQIANVTDTNLTANTRYWIYIPRTGGYPNYYVWGKDSSDPTYPNGNYWKNVGNYTHIDTLFKVYEQHYESSSNLISQIGDLGVKPESWGKFEATDSSPGDSRITYNIRTSSYTGGLSDAPWWIVYKGQTILGPTLNRYVQWVAFLVPTNTETPVVDDITINYNCRPTIPVLSSPTDSSILNDPTPTLTWNNSTYDDGDILTYRVLVDNNSDFSSPEVDVSNILEGVISTSYVLPALVDDTYYWKVCANDGSTNSDWSTTWSFTVENPKIVGIGLQDNGYFILWPDKEIKITFNRHMSSTTMTPENISIIDEAGDNVKLTKIVYVSSVTAITALKLEYCAKYTVEVSTGVKDSIDNPLTEKESFSFTTLIPGGTTDWVRIEHREAVVEIDDPSETFPKEGKKAKGWYIKLVEAGTRSPKDCIGRARLLRCYKVTDDGSQEYKDHLNSPVTISIPYPSDRKDKKNLRLYFYNNDVGRWELVEGSGDENPGDTDYYVTGEVKITNTQYCVIGFAMGGLIGEYSNYPNPFKAGKGKTTIEYYLEENAKVTISIYDLLGQLVRKIEIPKGTTNGGREGRNEVFWYGKNERGRVVANGGYYCVLEADTGKGKHMKKVRKIMVIK